MLIAVGEQLNPRDVGERLVSLLRWREDPLDAMLAEQAFPEGCASRRRMTEVMGLEADRHVNLLPPGEAWCARTARAGATLLRSWARVEGHCLALMGRKVATAFDLARAPFGTFALVPSPAVVLPHPSGLSRYLNTRENREAIRRSVRTFCRVFAV
ncbi:MAG: hypothetical protein ACYSYL_14795 [Planctomycetota bacterium]|jgi:hypothetical protein